MWRSGIKVRCFSMPGMSLMDSFLDVRFAFPAGALLSASAMSCIVRIPRILAESLANNRELRDLLPPQLDDSRRRRMIRMNVNHVVSRYLSEQLIIPRSRPAPA
jgi:hypothetical protein